MRHHRPASSTLRRFAAAALVVAHVAVLVAPGPAAAQGTTSSTLLGTGPRGLTDLPPQRPPFNAAAAAASAPAAIQAGSGAAGTSPVNAAGAGGSGTPAANAPRPIAPALPPDPATSLTPIVFGSQIFTGRFGTEAFSGFNPDYRITVGDRISVRMWGAFNFDAVQAVDVKGNIFIPNVGPISVLGVRNADLNSQLEAQLKRTFRSNVGVYATLEAAQPVKVYVTGFVRAPGLYGGLSSDSVLYYIDRAGGIDPDRGSYLEVDVMRAGQLRARINLYDFLLRGRIESLQLQDGDTIVANNRQHTVQVGGEVLNPYIFEFGKSTVTGAELMAVARPRPSATHLSVVRGLGPEQKSEYHSLSAAANVTIQDGDQVYVTSDKYPTTILVRVEGSHLGERSLVLPYGAQLSDAMARIKPAPQAQIEAVQLFRKSMATRQKELIETSLRGMETYALTARSATSEEAALRGREAQQILEFIDRARLVQPKGQVVLGQGTDAGKTLLEDGDVIRIPERSNLVLVSGEVLFPNALVYEAQGDVERYIAKAGGYTQGADRSKVLAIRQDGSVLPDARGVALQPGDEIMVLPKIETKNIEVTRGITQIVYQIAVAAKILFGL
jgi:protein involved in polysaccharide export with SLBB domain